MSFYCRCNLLLLSSWSVACLGLGVIIFCGSCVCCFLVVFRLSSQTPSPSAVELRVSPEEMFQAARSTPHIAALSRHHVGNAENESSDSRPRNPKSRALTLSRPWAYSYSGYLQDGRSCELSCSGFRVPAGLYIVGRIVVGWFPVVLGAALRRSSCESASLSSRKDFFITPLDGLLASESLEYFGDLAGQEKRAHSQTR